MGLLAARTARFLLLFAFVAVGLLSAAYIVQGAAEESNLVPVPERKAMENKMIGRKTVSGYYDSNMKMEKMKEKSERSRKLMHRENYQDKFVAFNADYKGPRHHPPKNN